MPTKNFKGGAREISEDFFETPSCAFLPILKYIPAEVKKIWEPTNGKDGISKHLTDYQVIKTDKFPKTTDTKEMDFLTDEPDFEYDMIIFNPPFSLKSAFLKRVLDFKKPFLFICPLTIIETQTRSSLFYEHQLSIINLNKRVNYLTDRKGSAFFHSIWVLNDGKSKIYYEPLLNDSCRN
jgi:hypothetical protein